MKKKREALCLCKVIIASNTVQQDGVCREVLCHKDAKKRLFRHGIGEGEACPLPKEFRPVAGSGNALSDAGDPDDLKDPIGAGRDYRLVFKVCLEGKVPCPVRLDKDRVCKMGEELYGNSRCGELSGFRLQGPCLEAGTFRQHAPDPRRILSGVQRNPCKGEDVGRRAQDLRPGKLLREDL